MVAAGFTKGPSSHSSAASPAWGPHGARRCQREACVTLGHPQGLGKPRAGVGASGSFHSSSGRASDVTPQLLPQHQGPSHSPLSRRPLKPPQGHQHQALRTQVGARGAGRGTSGLAGPGQALCLITYNQSFQEAGCVGPRTLGLRSCCSYMRGKAQILD